MKQNRSQPSKYEWIITLVDLGFLAYSIYRAITHESIIYYGLAAMWLGVGIYSVVRSVRAYKLEKQNQPMQEIVDPPAQNDGDAMNKTDIENK